MYDKDIFLRLIFRNLKGKKSLNFFNFYNYNYSPIIERIKLFGNFVSPLLLFSFLRNHYYISNKCYIPSRNKLQDLTIKYIKKTSKLNFLCDCNPYDMDEVKQFCIDNGILFSPHIFNCKTNYVIFSFLNDFDSVYYDRYTIRLVIRTAFNNFEYLQDCDYKIRSFDYIIKHQKKWRKKFFYKMLPFKFKIKYLLFNNKNKQEN